MKILLGITKSNLGGAQRYVLDLATELSKEGHNVGVVCGGKGILIEKLKHEKIFPVVFPNMGRDVSVGEDISSFFKILNLLYKNRPEVFHINSSKMGGIGVLAGRLAGIKKIVFTAHGWAFNEPERSWIQRKAIRFTIWMTILLSHQTICVSEKLKNDVVDLPRIKDKLVVIPIGIKPFKMLPREEAREKLIPNILSSTMLVGTLSELHKVKGLDVLLKVWKRFVEGKNAKLVIAGTGDERVNLHNMASSMAILESVFFTDYLDNARSYLSGFDVFALPSRSEGLPYSLLEAGLAEKPVIASNVGGIPEVIEDKRNGILVEPENKPELLEALTILYDNPVDRNIIGKSLKKTVETKFSIKNMVSKTLEIYKNKL